MHKAHHSHKKTILVIAIILAVLAAAAAGFFLLRGRGAKNVELYAVSELLLDYDYANEAQADGAVSTEKLQSVYISATQQVTEVYVTEGQTVAAGDPLLAFDTTLSDLELDRQEIKISQLELDIQKTKDELAEIATYRVGTPADPIYTAPTRTLTYPDVLPWYRSGIGTEGDPMVWLWTDSASFDDELIASLAAKSAELRAAATEPEPAEDASGEASGEPESEPEPIYTDDPYIYAVFEVRSDNAVNGDILRAWEMVFFPEKDGTFSFTITEPFYTPDIPEDDTEGSLWVDTAVYYTASEIATLKADATQKLADLNIQLKQAELEYQRLSYELSTGVVYSTVDGVVKTVRDIDEARSENKPAILVSGGGGYYVTAGLGELELGTMQVGDTVTVQSWENYQTLEGTIVEISEYPDESGNLWHYSEGNQNISLYPFKVFVDEDAELREGEYVTVTYSAGDTEGGKYLESAFVRQEEGRSYVYAVGADGCLEKRYIKTGQNLWGSYIEVLEGLTEDDYIVFPYGHDIREGLSVSSLMDREGEDGMSVTDVAYG